MSQQQEVLRQKYCPPLEESLFYAIASDYALDNTEETQQLESLLSQLRDQAVPEQELELAPPIQHDDVTAESSHKNSAISANRPKTATTNLDETLGSVTTGISDWNPYAYDSASGSATEETDIPNHLENASKAEKESWLKTLFPIIESVQISETVAKCSGNLQHSIDELLNLSFIHDDIDQNYQPPPVLKGVDGFASTTQSKKHKSKKNRRKYDRDEAYYSDVAASSGAVTPSNRWQNAVEDVEFIVSRTKVSTAAVKSIYHQHNANLSLTIKTLVVKEAEMQAVKIRTDEILPLQVAEIKLELEGVADIHIYGALLLAQMIPSAAKDLLESMMRRPQEVYPSKLVAQYAPISLSEGENPKRISKVPMASSDPNLLMGKAGIHSVNADRAFTQAQSAFRRGRSDHLMGGAAAYYAAVGHEQQKRRRELTSLAADAHVGQQSTNNSLDLHGVSVEHAVRIARNSVEIWWENLGDRKYLVGGIGNGYKIIVGRGTHSAQGIGRIGPAVSKMLMREGWKVNIQSGEVYVEGRVRR